MVDTNVIIDALTSRKPWNKSAEKLFIMAANHIADYEDTVIEKVACRKEMDFPYILKEE